MEQDFNSTYSKADIDLTKYIFVLFKKIKLLIIYILIFVLGNIIYQYYSEKASTVKIIVSQNDSIKFLLSPTTFENMSDMGFSVSDFFVMQKNNFLNYNYFLEDYDDFDQEVTSFIEPRDLFNLFEVIDITADTKEEIFLSEYLITSSLDPNDAGNLLRKIIVSSDKRTLKNLTTYFERRIEELKNQIYNHRNVHLGELELERSKLEYQVGVELDRSTMELQKQINTLKDNLSIAIKMGYEYPVLNDNQISTMKDEGEFEAIIDYNERGIDYNEGGNALMRDNLFFYGSKIIDEQINLLQKQMETILINDVNPSLASRIKNIDKRSSDAFIGSIGKIKESLLEAEIILDEISQLNNSEYNSSILTSYNTERVIVESKNKSIYFSSIIAALIGAVIGSIIIIIRYNIEQRLKFDSEFSLGFFRD